MKERPSIFVVPASKNWHNLLVKNLASPIANIRACDVNDILRALATANDKIFVFERPTLYDSEGRRAFEKVLGSHNLVAVLDDENDPMIMRCAIDPRIIYFKRELVKNFFAADVEFFYNLSLYRFAKRAFYGFLTSLEAFEAVRLGHVKPLPLTVATPETALATEAYAKRAFSVSFVAAVRGGWRNIGGYIPKMMYVRERLAVARVLAGIPNSYVRITGEGAGKPLERKLATKTYYEIIRNSISSVAVQGVGYDSVRYWEIPFLKTVLIARKPKTIIPHNFVDKKEAFFFTSYDELREIIEILNADKDLAQKVALAGYEKYLQYHSPEKRLSYMIDAIRSGFGNGASSTVDSVEI